VDLMIAVVVNLEEVVEVAGTDSTIGTRDVIVMVIAVEVATTTQESAATKVGILDQTQGVVGISDIMTTAAFRERVISLSLFPISIISLRYSTT